MCSALTSDMEGRLRALTHVTYYSSQCNAMRGKSKTMSIDMHRVTAESGGNILARMHRSQVHSPAQYSTGEW